MSHKKTLIIVSLFTFLVSLGFVFLINKFDLFFKKPAGLVVNTNISSQVLLDGKDLGSTPLTNNKLHPGEYTLTLKPLNQEKLSSWQSKIHLYRGVSTSVHYNFAFDVASSSGYITQYEPNSDSNQTTISVISDPDICSLSIDGQPKGFTPLKKTSISVGQHQLSFSSPGFQPLNLNLVTLAGSNLLVQVKLSQNLLTLDSTSSVATQSATSSTASTATPSASPKPPTTLPTSSTSSATINKPYVVIKPTGTGWLRVRKQPSTSAQELGKVDVGQKLKFIEANETGWYKVIFQDQEAWISGRYAELYR